MFSLKTNTMRVAAVAVMAVAVFVLCCAWLQRPCVNVAAPTAHRTVMVGLREPMGTNDACSDDACPLLGHMEPDTTRAHAARPPGRQTECEAYTLQLDWTSNISRRKINFLTN